MIATINVRVLDLHGEEGFVSQLDMWSTLRVRGRCWGLGGGRPRGGGGDMKSRGCGQSWHWRQSSGTGCFWKAAGLDAIRWGWGDSIGRLGEKRIGRRKCVKHERPHFASWPRPGDPSLSGVSKWSGVAKASVWEWTGVGCVRLGRRGVRGCRE